MDEIREIGIVNVISETGIGSESMNETGNAIVVAEAMAEVTVIKREDRCGTGGHSRAPEGV